MHYNTKIMLYYEYASIKNKRLIACCICAKRIFYKVCCGALLLFFS